MRPWKRARSALALVLTFAFLAVGCAANLVQQTTDPWTNMSPRDKAIWMSNAYKAQYDDYLDMAQRKDLTNAQKEVLAVKKQILREIWEPIKLYTWYVDKGAVPSPELEAQIRNALNDLGAKLSK